MNETTNKWENKIMKKKTDGRIKIVIQLRRFKNKKGTIEDYVKYSEKRKTRIKQIKVEERRKIIRMKVHQPKTK